MNTASVPPAEELTILVINPGSTSTKLSVFRATAGAGDPIEVEVSLIENEPENDIRNDLHTRLRAVCDFVERFDEIDCVAARSRLVAPVPAGTYRVCETMIDDLISCRFGTHASNLGAPLAA